MYLTVNDYNDEHRSAATVGNVNSEKCHFHLISIVVYVDILKVEKALRDEAEWLRHSSMIVDDGDEKERFSWTAYHALLNVMIHTSLLVSAS